jgi:hypothetical protein
MTTLLAHFLFLSLGCIQQPDLPRVRRVEAITKYSAEIVLQDLPVIFPDDQPISDGAVECYISAMKSTGLFKDIKVELTPTEDGKWIDILIRVAWRPEARNLRIGEIDFEGFDGFDVPRLRTELQNKGFHRGVPLVEVSRNEIANMLSDIGEEIYGSDQEMTDLFDKVDVARLRLYFQVVHDGSVKVSISLRRPDPCHLEAVGRW